MVVSGLLGRFLQEGLLRKCVDISNDVDEAHRLDKHFEILHSLVDLSMIVSYHVHADE